MVGSGAPVDAEVTVAVGTGVTVDSDAAVAVSSSVAVAVGSAVAVAIGSGVGVGVDGGVTVGPGEGTGTKDVGCAEGWGATLKRIHACATSPAKASAAALRKRLLEMRWVSDGLNLAADTGFPFERIDSEWPLNISYTALWSLSNKERGHKVESCSRSVL